MKQHLPHLDQHTKFFLPYVNSVKDLVNLKKLTRIKGFKVSLNKSEQIDGQLTRYLSDNTHVLTIRTHTITNGEYRKRTLEAMLFTLAHELAHLKEWDHCVEHYALQLKILNRFTKVLKKQNITNTATCKY